MFDSVDEDDAVILPSPQRVAQRALALAAISYRAWLERDRADPDAADSHRRLLSWLEATGLMPEFEPAELDLLCRPLGALARREEVNASWRAEGLGVLAWALGRYQLPAHDEQVDPPALGETLGFLTEDAVVTLAEAELRPSEELEDCAARLLAVHWRLRQFSLQPGHMDFQMFALNCEWARMPLDGLPLIDRDLTIGAVPLAQAPEAEWRPCLSIAAERHQAANWLLGQDPTYSEVTTDT